VPRVLHHITLHELRTTDLPELVKRLVVVRVVTATNQKDVAVVRVLGAAEVVRKVRVIRIVCVPNQIRRFVTNIDRHDAAGVLNQ
jgi:hypothetical protein